MEGTGGLQGLGILSTSKIVGMVLTEMLAVLVMVMVMVSLLCPSIIAESLTMPDGWAPPKAWELQRINKFQLNCVYLFSLKREEFLTEILVYLFVSLAGSNIWCIYLFALFPCVWFLQTPRPRWPTHAGRVNSTFQRFSLDIFSAGTDKSKI